jgi:hypothetical protein
MSGNECLAKKRLFQNRSVPEVDGRRVDKSAGFGIEFVGSASFFDRIVTIGNLGERETQSDDERWGA